MEYLPETGAHGLLPETLKIVAESILRLGTQILIAHRCCLGDSIRMFSLECSFFLLNYG